MNEMFEKLKKTVDSKVKEAKSFLESIDNGQQIPVLGDLVKEARKYEDKFWGVVNKFLGL